MHRTTNLSVSRRRPSRLKCWATELEERWWDDVVSSSFERLLVQIVDREDVVRVLLGREGMLLSGDSCEVEWRERRCMPWQRRVDPGWKLRSCRVQAMLISLWD